MQRFISTMYYRILCAIICTTMHQAISTTEAQPIYTTEHVQAAREIITPSIVSAAIHILAEAIARQEITRASCTPDQPVNVCGNIELINGSGIIFSDTEPSTNTISIAAPTTITTAYALHLPDAPGTAHQILAQSATPGILTWTSIGSLGSVTSVTASAPLASSGGATPNLTITQATTSTNGYLSATDWNTFNNKVNANGNTATTDMSIGSLNGFAMNLQTNNTSRIAISTAGTVTINAPTSGTTLTVTSGASQNAILASTGSTSAPTYSFISDSDTGLYSPGSGQYEFVSNGTANLRSDSTQSVSYATKYRAGVHNNADQALSANTNTAITFQAQDFDPHSNMSASGVYTVPVTGIYQLNAHVNITAGILTAIGTAQLFVSINTINNIQTQYLSITAIPLGSKGDITISTLISLTAGQAVMIGANTSAASTVTGGSALFSIHLLSV